MGCVRSVPLNRPRLHMAFLSLYQRMRMDFHLTAAAALQILPLLHTASFTRSDASWEISLLTQLFPALPEQRLYFFFFQQKKTLKRYLLSPRALPQTHSTCSCIIKDVVHANGKFLQTLAAETPTEAAGSQKLYRHLPCFQNADCHHNCHPATWGEDEFVVCYSQGLQNLRRPRQSEPSFTLSSHRTRSHFPVCSTFLYPSLLSVPEYLLLPHHGQEVVLHQHHLFILDQSVLNMND